MRFKETQRESEREIRDAEKEGQREREIYYIYI